MLTLNNFKQSNTPYGLTYTIRFKNNYGAFIVEGKGEEKGFYYLEVIRFIGDGDGNFVVSTENYVSNELRECPLVLEHALEGAEIVSTFPSRHYRAPRLTEQLANLELCQN